MKPDDFCDIGSLREALDEAAARLNELRKNEDEPSIEDAEMACAPVRHMIARMRNGGESDEGNDRGRVTPVELDEQDMQRRGSSGDFLGCRVSHITGR